MRFLTIAFLLISTISLAQNKGSISGFVKDKKNVTLGKVNIFVKGNEQNTTTNDEGKYSLSLMPGKYTLVFSSMGFDAQEKEVTVQENETSTLNITLDSGEGIKLNDVVVKVKASREKETALILEQKNAVVIKQSIGAQEMSRKGISDVEEGLTKITGISKVGDRGVFVRGLEDRYNSLLLNGLAAPSNTPYKKIIPLDLFPTDIVSVIEVFKTSNPSISGDFSGGTFNIQTLLNSKNETRISIGAGFATNNNFQDFLSSNELKSTKGILGFSGSDRALPSVLGTTATAHVFTPQEYAQSFKSGFNVDQSKSPLNTSLGLFHSERFNLVKNRTLSYVLSLNTENSYTIRSGEDNTFSASGDYYNKLMATTYRYKTQTSALVGVNYKSTKLNLSYNTLYLRSTDNKIEDQYGYKEALTDINNTLIRTNQLDQTDYFNNQLFGEYGFDENKKHTLKGGVSFAITNFTQPDRKFFSGALTGNTLNTRYGGNNFLRQYLDISGNYYSSSLLEYSLKFGKNDNRLSFGYNGASSGTESSYRFIAPKQNFSPSFDVNLNTPDNQITSDVNNGVFSFNESSNATYKVKMNEMSNAAYSNLLYKPSLKWEINGGVRLENTSREIFYRNPGSFNDPYQKKAYENIYILPSVSAKYVVSDKSNIRFASSKSYTRPVTMEVFPLEYINANGTSIVGNKYLKNSDNYNVDLKFEMFPTAKEMASITVFGKQIINPIERTFSANAGGAITSFSNSNNALIYGLEFDFLLDFERFSKNLKNISFGFNTSLMQTQVKVDDVIAVEDDITHQISTRTSIETHKNRQLQGASNWVVNSDLKYQFDFSSKWKNTVSLVYSVFGKRIYSVGTAGLDHIYELPVNKLDLVWGNKIGERWDIKFSADNLLNPVAVFEMGDANNVAIIAPSRIVNSTKRGVGFSVGLTYKF